MRVINGGIPVEVETEYGVMFDDGFVAIMGDEEEAFETKQMAGGVAVARDVMTTPWGEIRP